MFSIIIPTLNNLSYLKLCIESIQKNSKYNHEIIPHVNVGTDGTLEYLKKNNIKFTYTKDNSGICKGMNLAAKDQKLANYIALRFGLIQYRFWNFAILSKIPINNDALARIHSTSQQEYEDESSTYLKNYYPTSIKHSP